MKTLNILLIAIFLMTFSRISAQDQPKSDKEQEQELQQAIREQKRAMNEQRKAQEQAQKEIQQDQQQSQKDLQENLNNLDVLKEYNFDIQSDDNGNVRVFRGRGGNHNMVPLPPDVPNFYFNRFGDDAERTSWDFSKSVKENSFKRDYTFDVEKTVKTVVMSVNGDCKAGEISIKIVTPNGKTFSDIVIDEFGNLNWRKSFNISDTENQDKTGDWTFKINSNKATGHFRISLQTF